MKKAIGVLAAIIIIVGILTGYYFWSAHNKTSVQDEEVTEVQKLINKNLTSDYPATPREVVKLYNRILKVYYGGDYTDEEFDKLVDQTLLLFDDDLLEENPKSSYVSSLTSEIEDYKENKKSIVRADLCDSNDVEYLTDKGDSLAYVSTSYFIKEGNSYSDTNEMYVLRQDADGNWKILVYYKTAPDSADDDD